MLLVLGSRYGIQRFVQGAFSVPVGAADPERAESIELRFDNLHVRKGSKTLIDGASGHFSRGKVQKSGLIADVLILAADCGYHGTQRRRKDHSP